MNQKDPTGDDSAEGAHGRPPDLVLLLRGEVGSRGELGRWRGEVLRWGDGEVGKIGLYAAIYYFIDMSISKT